MVYPQHVQCITVEPKTTNTVKPVLKATCVKRPPVSRDHLQVLPMHFPLQITCVKRLPAANSTATPYHTYFWVGMLHFLHALVSTIHEGFSISNRVKCTGINSIYTRIIIQQSSLHLHNYSGHDQPVLRDPLS